MMAEAKPLFLAHSAGTVQVVVLGEGTGDGATVDGEELALLQQMGLPTTFGTSKVHLSAAPLFKGMWALGLVGFRAFGL